jgi:hypothetical protein
VLTAPQGSREKLELLEKLDCKGLLAVRALQDSSEIPGFRDIQGRRVLLAYPEAVPVYRERLEHRVLLGFKVSPD